MDLAYSSSMVPLYRNTSTILRLTTKSEDLRQIHATVNSHATVVPSHVPPDCGSLARLHTGTDWGFLSLVDSSHVHEDFLIL